MAIPGIERLPAGVQTALLPVSIWLLYGVVSRLALLVVRSSSREGTRVLIRRTRLPIQLLLVVATARAALPLPEVVERFVPLILVFAFAVLAQRAIGTVFVILRRQFDITAADNLRARRATTQIMVLERLVTVTVVVVAMALALMTIPEVRRYGTSLLASAGVAGLVIGFAAQQTIANVLAGIQIAITQPLRIDDAVVIDGEWGWVEELTLTYVVVRVWDRRRLVVPISYLLQRPFQNWTRTTASVIGTVVIHADYTVDVEALRREQSRLLAAHELWDGDVDVVQVVDTTERSVVIRSLVSAANSSRAWDLRCYLREALIRWLHQNQPEALPRERLRVHGSIVQGTTTGRPRES